MIPEKELRIFSIRFFDAGNSQYWRIGYSLDNEKLLYHDIAGIEAEKPSDEAILEALESATSSKLNLVDEHDITESDAEDGKPVTETDKSSQ